MDNVFIYTRMPELEEPVIEYFKNENLWAEVYVVGKSFTKQDIMKGDYIDEYTPRKIYNNIYPYLSKFMDMCSRDFNFLQMNYKEYNIHDLLNLFNIYINFFYNFFEKNKISLFVINRSPHNGFDLIAYLVAKELNIRTILMEQSHFPNRFFIYTDQDDYGTFKTSKKVISHKALNIENKYKKELFYMKSEKLNLKQKLKQFYGSNNLIRLLSQLTHKELRGQALYRFDLKNEFQKNKNKHNQPIDLSERFVYFALHLQPEKTTANWGGKYVDQVLAVERLSGLVPPDVKIYVKENPKQGYFMRGKYFYKRLKQMKNVTLVPNDTNTYDLIKNSLFVSTVTGTVGWEAISGGKNALVFGWGVWYKTLPGVFSFDDDPDFQEIIDYEIDFPSLERKLNQLLDNTGRGVIYPNEGYKNLVTDYSEEENVKNVIASLTSFIYNSNVKNKM